MTALLDVRNLTKRYGGLEALSAVSLTVARGEIYGLIGPNGAGKTTFFDVLTGFARPSGGELRFADAPLAARSPHEIAKAGIARTFQNVRLFKNMTAIENVMVGCHARTHTGVIHAILRTSRSRHEERAIHERAHGLLDYMGIAKHRHDLALSLSYGDQRRLEIARALATDPKLLALDEPAAGMSATETAALRLVIERIRGDGTTIVLIEHDMKLVMALCDRVAVLDYGKKIAESSPAEIQRDPAVIAAYLGGALA